MYASQIARECSICYVEFKPGDKVEVFACHRTHMLHTECFETLKSHAEKKKSPLICPLCREPVDVSKIERKQLLALEYDVQEDDPFAIGEAM